MNKVALLGLASQNPQKSNRQTPKVKWCRFRAQAKEGPDCKKCKPFVDVPWKSSASRLETVWRLDRLGRSFADLIGPKETRGSGIGFVSLMEAFEMTTPTGRAMAGMLAVLAESR